MLQIAVIASHNGTNLQAIIDACETGALNAAVCCVISNNSTSGAAERARRHGIPFHHLSSVTHPDPANLDRAICDTLLSSNSDLIFLAGYMKKLGPRTLAQFSGRILNTHPTLLPKFGGHGMFGMNVHRAVIASGETETGISIHLVDADYDTGRVIAQAKVPVLPSDTPETLCDRVMRRERRFVVEVLQRMVVSSRGYSIIDRTALSQ